MEVTWVRTRGVDSDSLALEVKCFLWMWGQARLGKLGCRYSSWKQEDAAGSATATVGWKRNSFISQRWECPALQGGISRVSQWSLIHDHIRGLGTPLFPMNRRMGSNALSNICAHSGQLQEAGWTH